MGHTISNVLVKYVREHIGDICPTYEQFYSSSMSHISSMVLEIIVNPLNFFTRENRVFNFLNHVPLLQKI